MPDPGSHAYDVKRTHLCAQYDDGTRHTTTARPAVRGGAASWNVRDEHMADTLDRLLEHAGQGAKGVVWAHNTHIGDAAATDMAAHGLTNLARLTRERHGDDRVVLVGQAGHRAAR